MSGSLDSIFREEGNMNNVPMVVDNALSEQKINPQNVNLMLPSQTFGAVLGQYDKVTMEVVKVDPDPKAGEVFDIDGSGKKCLGKVPLQKIASALSIIWDPKETGIVESTETKSRAKATGAMRKPNGEWVIVSEEKSIDLSADEESYRLKYEEEAEKGNFNKVTEWGTSRNGKKFPKSFASWDSEDQKNTAIDRAVRKALLQRRKFKDELAMTGAKNRVIRAFIGVKSTYTDVELQKPFAFPRVTVDTGKLLNDPTTRQKAIERMTGSVDTIFGNGNGHAEERNVTPQIEASAEEAPQEEEADIFDDEPGEETEDKPDRREELKLQLHEYLEYDETGNISLSAKSKEVIQAAIDDPDITEEQLEDKIAKIQKYFADKEGAAS
jgi:hypothetical protein